MANGFSAEDSSAAAVEILTKQVVHTGLGITGQEQVVILADGAAGQNLGAIDAQGAVLVLPKNGATASVVSKTAAITDQTLLAANTNRICARIFNNSTATLYVQFGGAADTSANFVMKIASNGLYEINDYTGVIHGISDAANGTVQVTEVTP